MAPEEAIQMLMTVISGINREQSQTLLNRNNNDVNQAVNFYYEDPTTALKSISTNWTEPPPYSTVNDGEFQAYNIHAPDVNHSGIGHATAPSRPPSRNSTHGDIQDLSDLHAAADPNERLTEKERNDPLIQQEQQRLNGMHYGEGQTTGITRSGQSFRKVNNNHPNTDQWVMTTSSAVTPDLPPEHRRRREGEPTFLRSPSGDSYLGPLLTIYHAIPLARDALLFKRFPKRDSKYGVESQWWNGESIVRVRIIDNDYEDEETANAYEVVHEVQRLMAFLDNTDRAFGSTSPLSKMACLAGISADPQDPFSDSDVYRLLQFWRGTINDSRTIDDPAEFQTVFESRAVKTSSDLPLGIPPQSKTFNFIGGPEVTTGRGETLYDELDRFIWKDYVGQPIDDVWIDELAEIVTFRFGHENRNGEGLEIPAVWYPDRYLQNGREAAREMREKKMAMMQEAYVIDQSRRKLLHHVVNGEARNVRDDLLAAVGAAEKTAQGAQKDVSARENSEMGNVVTQVSLTEAEACIARLKAMVESIDKKAQSLEEQYQRALDSIQQTAHNAAQAAGSRDAAHKHKYTLRGVSTHPHITYALYPPSSESAHGEHQGHQWYRVSFSVQDGQEQRKQLAKEAAREAAKTSGTNLQQGWESLKVSEEVPGYTVRRVSEEEVLKAARDESKTVLLVYASEKAVTYVSTDLSHNEPLQASRCPDISFAPLLIFSKQFVDVDNRNFAAELRGLDPLHTDLSLPLDPVPNTAGTGSSHTLSNNPFSPADGETEPLIGSSRNPQGSFIQSGASSATLHSGSNSITRSEDGQASPKRAKGYDDRLPTSLQESERDETISGTRGVEMQEKAGGGLLGLGAAGAIAKAAAQSPKAEDDDVEMQHVEFAD